MNGKTKSAFQHFREPGAPTSRKADIVGYILEDDHRGMRRKEYLIPNPKFVEIAGGEVEAEELKHELRERGLIETHGEGKNLRFSIKRQLPDGSRGYFIVLRQKPKR